MKFFLLEVEYRQKKNRITFIETSFALYLTAQEVHMILEQTDYTSETLRLKPYPDPLGLTLNEHREPLPKIMEVECTTNMQYLNQYYFIREHVYRNDLQVKTFSGAEEEADRNSHLIVARVGHFCVGGLRLTISTPGNRRKLALERGDFELKRHVEGLEDIAYCDIGRVAVLPQYRDSKAISSMLSLAVDIAKQHDCQFMFGASPPALARLFQRTLRHLGYHDELVPGIPMPTGKENSHLKLILQIVPLN